jgi:hypothetical protein
VARSFGGRQSEELYNVELYKLFEVLKTIIDIPSDPSIGPETTREGSLWIDRQTSEGDLKFFKDGSWKLLFNDRFRLLGELLSTVQPNNPLAGQLWLNSGVLMYYSGSEWLPVRAVNVDSGFSLQSFEQFLLISPMVADGNQVIVHQDTNGDGIDETIYKSQFLLPSVELDRFFINGVYTDTYDAVTNVAIQYPSESLQGKVASAVHVNPNKLVGITKRLILVDKANPIIPASELNTEYYGFNGAVGHLLLKTDDMTSEYTSVPQGIKLSEAAAIAYDFVLAITYKFKDVKQSGSLKKLKLPLCGSNSIYIGTVTDPINVFVQGFYLDGDPANYTYDSSTGYLKLTLPSKMDVSVISFIKKEAGTITALDGSNRGIVTMGSTYTKPLVFVYGDTLRGLADYTQGTGADSNKLFVKDAKVGMKYSIVETMGGTQDSNMFVKSGVTTGTSIPCSFSEIPGDMNYILFAAGLMVTQKDLDRDEVSGAITTTGITAGTEYVLLKDPGNRLLFSDTVSFSTIPTGSIDDAMIYIQNLLVCDSAPVQVSMLPATGIQGEIKRQLTAITDKWYQYDVYAGWKEITDTAVIDKLKSTTTSYSCGKKSISILQNFGNVDCSYYGYVFANSIEEPLLCGYIDTNDAVSDYSIAFNHSYPVGANAMSIYLDGIRQYPDTSVTSTPNGIVEVNSSTVKLPTPVNSKLFYVIEKPERNESKSCIREVLTPDNRIAGTQNVYQTVNPLYPGNVRVYVSGLRQPSSAYKIIDSYTIMFYNTLIGGTDNFPVESVEQDGKMISINHTVCDKVLIETRQDFNLREITLPVRYAGQSEWMCADAKLGGDSLPKELLDSKDLVMIYVNGLAYGKEYKFNFDTESIVLTNSAITSRLGVDPIDDYFKKNADAYLAWKKRTGLLQYTPKPIKDKITFEWR